MQFKAFTLADKIRWNEAGDVPVKFMVIGPDDNRVIELEIAQMMLGDDKKDDLVIQLKAK
jgi:hypothetical protein